MRTILLVLVFCATMVAQVSIPFPGPGLQQGTAACGNGWTHCRTLTLGTISGTLTNYPVKVAATWANLAVSGSGGSVQNTTTQTGAGRSFTVPADAIFATDTTCATALKFEWEVWTSTTGAFVAWIRIPSAATGGTFAACYGKASVTTWQGDVPNTWSANYAGVWHLPDGTTLTMKDSTGNANDGTGVNTPTATSGEIDGAVSLNGTNQSVNVGNGASLGITGAITVNAWIFMPSLPGSNVEWMIFTKDKDSGGRAYTFEMANNFFGNGINTVAFYINGGANSNERVVATTDMSANTWYHVAATFTPSTNLKIYVNGTLEGTTSTTDATIPTATANVVIGAREYSGFENPFAGKIDEVRNANTDRTAAWIAADFAQGAGFVTVGSEL